MCDLTHTLALPEVCIYKYTSRAGDLLPAYADKDVGLYQVCHIVVYSVLCSCGSPVIAAYLSHTPQVQIEHEVARNGVAFKFKERFVQYLRAARETDPTIPATLEDLAEKAGIHVIQAGGLDGMKSSVAVPWRVALYVAGDETSVKNALLLLDGYFIKETRDEMPVHFHPHLGVDIKDILQDFCSCVH